MKKIRSGFKPRKKSVGSMLFSGKPKGMFDAVKQAKKVADNLNQAANPRNS